MITRIRRIVQILWTALTNGYAYGYVHNKIYKGKYKKVCVPGLNCYSCPGALGSCPVGAIQAVLSDGNKFSFYMIGFFLLIGSIFGRFICGWLCPFGLVQDLLYKIPFFRKRKSLPGHEILKNLKYIILLVFVIILPMTVLEYGMGKPWFCKWICPSGTLLAGWPLVGRDPSLQQITGFLFQWKSVILIVILVLSLWVYRPFCKYLCPLGGIYSLFNRFSLYKLQIDKASCTHCGACTKACPMSVPVEKKPNHAECIRCGKCSQACPQNAIHMGFYLTEYRNEK